MRRSHWKWLKAPNGGAFKTIFKNKLKVFNLNLVAIFPEISRSVHF